MVWARNSVANASDTVLDQMHIGIFRYGISDTLPFIDLHRSIQIPLKSQKISLELTTKPPGCTIIPFLIETSLS